MTRRLVTLGGVVGLVVVGALFFDGMPAPAGARSGGVQLPAPAVDPSPAQSGPQVIVFSGGCFWGVQAVFQHVKGVLSATAGYTGGDAATATYPQVSTGRTGHAESVRVAYDPTRVSFGRLLQIFFSVVHDPTELNRQGPDDGTQYRSAIWTTTPQQTRTANAYISQLTQARSFPRPIVTQVRALHGFYRAETYHQDYLIHHPDQAYIVINDIPKVNALRREFPSLWRGTPAPWREAATS